MPAKSLEATIDFLLTCMECTEGKVNWEEVATKTGWYKSGKFSRQAFVAFQKKYRGTVIGKVDDEKGDGTATADNGGAVTGKAKATKQAKKRTAKAAALDADPNGAAGKKRVTAKEPEQIKKENAEEDDEDDATVKSESE